MIKVGIDDINFYTPPFSLDLTTLSKARGLDLLELSNITGQRQISICPPDEDVVTMAANAAYPLLENIEKNQIELLLFATESGIDQSKAAGIYVHQLLDLPKRCRVIELKQACYGATAGLQLAKALLQQYPDKKALLIASDIARYELNTSAEPSQGAGAVAMLLTANPRLASIQPDAGFYTEDAMDFWRPNYRREAFVDGRLSCDLYIKVLKETWQQYSSLTGSQLSDYNYFCYHTPIPRLVETAHKRLTRSSERQALDYALQYSRVTGNCYTASLYIGLVSLLDHCPQDLAKQSIGMYSYGSGCTGEFFAITVEPQYQRTLRTKCHQTLLDNRQPLNYEQYVQFYQFPTHPTNGHALDYPSYTNGRFRLTGIHQHKRVYKNTNIK